MPDRDNGTWFTFFNEVGILAQLSRALLEARLPEGYLLTHFSVLNHLIRVADGRTPLELARAFQVPKASLNHTLSGLVRGGLVRMTPNPEDGRSKCVWITPEGCTFRDAAIEALGPDLARLARRFDSGRIAALLPDLACLRAEMDAMRNEKPPRRPPEDL